MGWKAWRVKKTYLDQKIMLQARFYKIQPLLKRNIIKLIFVLELFWTSVNVRISMRHVGGNKIYSAFMYSLYSLIYYHKYKMCRLGAMNLENNAKCEFGLASSEIINKDQLLHRITSVNSFY